MDAPMGHDIAMAPIVETPLVDPAAVLLVEDMPALARLYIETLSKVGIAVDHAETGAEALAALAQGRYATVLLDLNLPDMNGMEILQHIREQQIPVAPIVITAHGSVNIAVEAMRLGAFDFLVKPFPGDRLTVTVRNTLERMKLQREVDAWREELGRDRYYGFIGRSPPMQAVYRIIDSAAASKATVFITGESGTGKELCAEAVHRRSPRRDQPFIALNCGAIPRDLMESEIFGHVKGAFTGAVADRDGAAVRADGGTLFLDEIGELPPELQTKLLRFLQTGSVQAVGGSRERKVDLRIICATNRDPAEDVRQGRFREDLYYRLLVIPVTLPPLREREDDMLLIARQFLRDYAAEEGKAFIDFDLEVAEDLQRYAWPGNVRQLQNVVRNIVVLHDGPLVTRAMLPNPVRTLIPAAQPGRPIQVPPPAPNGEASPVRPLWMVEKETIEAAIAACDGHVPRAAALLGISASTIYRKRLNWEAEGRD
jgi:DNA-binding NtrC family response regulator